MKRLGQWRKDLLDPLAWYLSFRELKQHFVRTLPDEIIETPWSYQGRGHYAIIRPSQKRSELKKLAEIVAEKNPKTIMEIGTHRGGTLWVWSRIADQAEQIISLDLRFGEFGGGYHPNRQRLYRSFVADRPKTEMTLMQMDSHQQETLNNVLALLNGRPVDFLFIDGDHTYEGVKRDFELYSPLVSEGGIVAFHDLIPRDGNYGVHLLWRELKPKFRHFEFIDKPDQKSMGIGVLFMEREKNSNSFQP